MDWINRSSRRFAGWPGGARAAARTTEAVQGTIQRVDYKRREVRVIAHGRAWRFALAVDCQLWFDDTPAILRCFHPLDPVTVLYQDEDAEHVARAMYSRER